MKVSLLFFLLHSSAAVYCQGEWNLKVDKPDIKVYNRRFDSAKFSAVRVEATFKGRLSQLATILFDVPHHKDWSYATNFGYVIKKVSESEVLFYKEITTPPPLSNRDFVGSLSITQNPTTKIMSVEVKAVEGLVPEKQGRVRVHFTQEDWKVTPGRDGTIKIEYILKVDPGGSVSPFLVNMFATKAPYETFKNLKDVLLARSNTQVRSFIKD